MKPRKGQNLCYSHEWLKHQVRPFSRRAPDIITEELVAAFASKTTYEFKPLFDLIFLNLRARNAASGGEEMLRLRSYEKLQSLVDRGAVKKTVTGVTKKYKGVSGPVVGSERRVAAIAARLESARGGSSACNGVTGSMARPNYSGEKRRKELEKQRKKEEKKRRKLEHASAPADDPSEGDNATPSPEEETVDDGVRV